MNEIMDEKYIPNIYIYIYIYIYNVVFKSYRL